MMPGEGTGFLKSLSYPYCRALRGAEVLVRLEIGLLVDDHVHQREQVGEGGGGGLHAEAGEHQGKAGDDLGADCQEQHRGAHCQSPCPVG